jgi:hypothetical protein
MSSQARLRHAFESYTVPVITGHLFSQLVQSVKNLEELAILMRRPKKGIEARSAVLESERYDIVRGKDFVRWVRANLETVELFTTKGLLKIRMPYTLLKH